MSDEVDHDEEEEQKMNRVAYE
jgi:hypothetical protein